MDTPGKATLNDPTAALWRDPAPRTFEGRRLWERARLGLYRFDDAASIRDLGQRICQIEDEATNEAIARAVERVAGPPPVAPTEGLDR